MGFFEVFGDGEIEFIILGGMMIYILLSVYVLFNDMKDEIEIVFFFKGFVLVEQGERNLGFYYVIDGFLDIGIINQEGGYYILFVNLCLRFNIDMWVFDDFDFFLIFVRIEILKDMEEFQWQNQSCCSIGFVKFGGFVGYIGSVLLYWFFIDVIVKMDVYVGFFF